MAPVPASLSSGPSWVSTLTFSIGDKKQIIVYTAILVSFIALFVIGFVYVLRMYNTSASDEESNTTSTPRPPLRILIPGVTSQRAPSSSSTLVTPFKTGPTPVKRSGSGPSPLVCCHSLHALSVSPEYRACMFTPTLPQRPLSKTSLSLRDFL